MIGIDDPVHLRLLAAEMRARVENAVHPETKQGLSRIADDYDVLAQRAEQRLAAFSQLAEGQDQSAIDSAIGEQKDSPNATDETVSEFPLEPPARPVAT